MISLVDEKRQWFKSKIGLTESETSRDIAFCAHGILQDGVFVVKDAQRDERFASNPLVTGDSKIRFYAGSPLITPDGQTLGMLCVYDQTPRELTAEQKAALRALSRRVVAQLEMRRRVMELRQTVTQLKRTEDELRSKTAFLEAQVNASVDGILVVDGEGRKILQNERLTDLFKTPRHLVDEQEDQPQLEWVMGVIKNLKHFMESLAYVASHPDAMVRDELELLDGTILDRYSSPVISRDGGRYGRIWTFRDITARKQADSALRESDERFQQLADNIHDVFWITSIDLKVMHYVSPAYELIWGRPTASLYANPHQWIEAILPEERAHTLAAFALLMGNTSEVSVEYRIARPDGTVRWILDRAYQVKNAAGQVIRITGLASDITERKRIEVRMHRLVNSNAQGVIFWNANGGITQANDAFLKLVHCTRADLNAGRINWRTLTPPEYAYLDRRCLEELAVSGVGRPYEKEYVLKDGSRVPVLVVAATFEDNSGEGVGFFIDLTERKGLEARLFQSQKLETVGRLAGGIAHEFNSILTAIIGQSDLLLRDLPPGTPFAKSATEISLAATRAATLTRQLLAYGRKQLLQPEALDLNGVLARMEGVFKHLMGGEVHTQIVPAPGLKAVMADAGQIEQVIMNMAMNARDAMPNGGILTMETANVSFDHESVGRDPELKPGEYVMLAVTDTGTGMAEEVKARVFEPFYSTKGVGQGTGLGLSTCYGIVKQSGGHISVYSEMGRGATFKIYLPQAQQPTDVPLQRLTSPDLPCGTETILLVEDDPALREMAGTLLRRLGYTVWVAGNGIEALSLKQQRGIGHIDLLFTDVVMPHMSGKELADRMQVLFPHTKILFTSAYAENAIVQQGVLHKGVELLQKPFTPSALASKLREVLDQPVAPAREAGQDALGFAK